MLGLRILGEQNAAPQREIRADQIFDRVKHNGVMHKLVQKLESEMRVIAVFRIQLIRELAFGFLESLRIGKRLVFRHHVDRVNETLLVKRFDLCLG